MILRIEQCPKCKSQVAVILPELFPNLTANKLEKYKRLSVAPIEGFCKKCKNKEDK